MYYSLSEYGQEREKTSPPTSQRAQRLYRGTLEKLLLPGPREEVIRDIPWGDFDRILTPAFWKVQCWISKLEGAANDYRFGNSLCEEVIACVLGGYGMPAETGHSAFFALVDAGLVAPGASEASIYARLSAPLTVRGKAVRYRFPRQKARHLAAILEEFANSTAPPVEEPRRLVEWLVRLPGVGPKTAAWILRNMDPDSPTAVLDIHVLRAGRAIGLFRQNERVDRDYYRLQEKYLNFCEGLDESPGVLDAVIWRTMKDLGRYGTETAAAMAMRRKDR